MQLSPDYSRQIFKCHDHADVTSEEAAMSILETMTKFEHASNLHYTQLLVKIPTTQLVWDEQDGRAGNWLVPLTPAWRQLLSGCATRSQGACIIS